jgi:hypothetical protein
MWNSWRVRVVEKPGDTKYTKDTKGFVNPVRLGIF